MKRRSWYDTATTRADEMVPFVRAERHEEPADKPQERISEPCADCRWHETCLGDGICWDAVRLAREAGERAERRPAQTSIERRRRDQERWTREAIIEAIQAWAQSHDGKPPTIEVWRLKSDDHPRYARVRSIFGTWNAAIRAAGLEPHSRWAPRSIRR